MSPMGHSFASTSHSHFNGHDISISSTCSAHQTEDRRFSVHQWKKGGLNSVQVGKKLRGRPVVATMAHMSHSFTARWGETVDRQTSLDADRSPCWLKSKSAVISSTFFQQLVILCHRNPTSAGSPVSLHFSGNYVLFTLLQLFHRY